MSVQDALVFTNNIALRRKFGWFGMMLALRLMDCLPRILPSHSVLSASSLYFMLRVRTGRRGPDRAQRLIEGGLGDTPKFDGIGRPRGGQLNG
jgi:hypothetical protein